MDGNELVKKMLETFLRLSERAPYVRPEIDLEAMAAAAKICIDEALGDVTAMEWSQACPSSETGFLLPGKGYEIASATLRNRKARLLAPKIAESRVTIEPCPLDSWKVLLDGKFHFGGNGVAKCDAEIYRDGLILKLKEQQS
jgi:hypothetical protein